MFAKRESEHEQTLVWAKPHLQQYKIKITREKAIKN